MRLCGSGRGAVLLPAVACGRVCSGLDGSLGGMGVQRSCFLPGTVGRFGGREEFPT